LTVYAINPLEDSRWADLVEKHASGSIFHTPGWLRALRLTYDYEPVVFTTSPPQARLTNGIVFCPISSWLTGRRMVSLPFADHCEPLWESREERDEMFSFLRQTMKTQSWKYIEIRPRTSGFLSDISTEERGSSFCFHALDLRPSLDALFAGLQKSSIQRMIRRAEREGLSCEKGRCEVLLEKFYRLMLKTRRRHKLPPQPISWFRNLINCLGERLSIRVASKNGEAMAGILTLSHRRTLVYKYGCSDERFHHWGSVPFLLWNAIQEAKETDFQEFDLGRSDIGNSGLIRFKDRWGGKAALLQYVKLSNQPPEHTGEDRRMRVAKRFFAYMPDGLLTAAGKLLYRHIG
jgi:GNAT acetyltransferase-like protein